MNRTLYPMIGMLAVALATSTGHAQIAVETAKLPEAVAKTFKTKFPKAKIARLDVETENGVTIYDFEFKDEGIDKESDIAADGTMLEHTLVVAAESVPAPAMKSIRTAADGATIERLEHTVISYEVKEGKIVQLPEPRVEYEAEMTRGKQRGEVVVAPDGTIIEPAKWWSGKEEKNEDHPK